MKGIAIAVAAVALLLALFFTGLYFATVAGFGGDEGPHPSDAKLEREFRERRADYESLLELSRADPSCARIAPTWFDCQGATMPNERLAHYRELFAKLELESGVSHRLSETALYFVRSSRGLAVSGSSKGIAYSEVPHPTVADTEPASAGTGAPYTVYKHLEGSWYLYYEVDP
jgi:hypothetical protein